MPENATTGLLRFAYWVPNINGGLVTSAIDRDPSTVTERTRGEHDV